MKKVKVLIGLGNPDDKYRLSRHNLGHLMIDWIDSLPGFSLLKSTGYMNNSGSYVAQILQDKQIRPEDLIILHDDWAFDLGEYKIQFGRGPNGHNGVENIIRSLKTSDFWRVRVGIGCRPDAVKGDRFVLDDFTNQELSQIKELINPIKKQLVEMFKTQD